MNGIEHFLCSTSLWRCLTQRQVLPWVLSGARLTGAGFCRISVDFRRGAFRLGAVRGKNPHTNT
jgi:hypothetical protein